MLDTLWQDVRYALRSLRRTPGFTLAAVITLALGIGANTAIFSVANAVVLRPLHAPGAERLVRFAMTYDGTPAWPTGLDGFNHWRQQTAFDDVSAHWLEFANLTNGSYPEQISVARVTNRFFYLFGAPVIKGRTFTIDEDHPGAPPVVVLSAELWTRQFGADPGPDGSAVTTDWRVLLFTLVVSAVAGIVFGLLPAIQAGRADLTAALKHTDVASATGVRGNTMRALLVVSEIALALVLLIGAGLLLRTTVALLSVDRGFDLQNVLTLRMSVSGTPFETRAGLERLTRDGVDRIQATPGVAVASAACCVPLENVWQLLFVIAGRPPNGTSRSVAGWTFVSPGYFEALRIPLIRGRAFTDTDVAGAPGVVLINEAMARRFWPSSDPLSDQLTLGRGMRLGFDNDPPRQVIGIVGDVREQSLNRPPRPAMYVPVAQLPDDVATFFVRQLPLTWIVRTAVDPLSIGAPVERALRAASHDLPVTRIRSMNEVAADSIARTRFATLLMTTFGCAAALLAAIGVYAMMASSVTQRTRDIGIRVALGAESRQVRNMVLAEGMTLTVLGITAGTASALVVSRVIARFLFGVTARDPAVFITAPTRPASAALVAVWLPARRAARLSPAMALRAE